MSTSRTSSRHVPAQAFWVFQSVWYWPFVHVSALNVPPFCVVRIPNGCAGSGRKSC
jgi:hypothetical protein